MIEGRTVLRWALYCVAIAIAAALIHFAADWAHGEESTPVSDCPGPRQCGQGNVEWRPVEGYLYTDGSAHVMGDSVQVRWRREPPWEVKSVCFETAEGGWHIQGTWDFPADFPGDFECREVVITSDVEICEVVIVTDKPECCQSPTPVPVQVGGASADRPQPAVWSLLSAFRDSTPWSSMSLPELSDALFRVPAKLVALFCLWVSAMCLGAMILRGRRL